MSTHQETFVGTLGLAGRQTQDAVVRAAAAVTFAKQATATCGAATRADLAARVRLAETKLAEAVALLTAVQNDLRTAATAAAAVGRRAA